MPRLSGLQERLDRVYFDTHLVGPNMRKRYFGADCSLDPAVTNIAYQRGVLHPELPTFVFAIGLRLFGKTRDEEDRLLDQFQAELWIGDKPYGAIPGHLLSTFRYVNEEDEIAMNDLARAEARECGACDMRMAFLPGYVLQRPITIPVRQYMNLTVTADPALKAPLVVRAMLFTLLVRDVC